MVSNEMGVPNYASVDQVEEASFIVRMIPPVGLVEESTTRFFSSWNGLNASSLEDASATVASIAWNPRDQFYEPHVLEQRFERYEWGASGTGLQFILDVSSGITADAILLGIGYVVGRLRHADPPRPEVSDLLQLESFARRAVSRSFDLAGDEALELRSSESVGRTGQFHFEDSSHNHYDAIIGQLDSGEPYVKITRRGQDKPKS